MIIIKRGQVQLRAGPGARVAHHALHYRFITFVTGSGQGQVRVKSRSKIGSFWTDKGLANKAFLDSQGMYVQVH